MPSFDSGYGHALREEGTPSMDSRTHDRTPSPDAVEFVRFCYGRRRVGWPELYDEMCAVAGRGLFRGWGSEELNAEGIAFGLFDMPSLAALVHEIVAEEHVRRTHAAAAVQAPAVARAATVVPTVTPEPAAEPPVEPTVTVRFAPVPAGA
jgi:hypothetical protein